jgi:hypothetical protein
MADHEELTEKARRVDRVHGGNKEGTTTDCLSGEPTTFTWCDSFHFYKDIFCPVGIVNVDRTELQFELGEHLQSKKEAELPLSGEKRKRRRREKTFFLLMIMEKETIREILPELG